MKLNRDANKQNIVSNARLPFTHFYVFQSPSPQSLKVVLSYQVFYVGVFEIDLVSNKRL
jgi:hypothetical protein